MVIHGSVMFEAGVLSGSERGEQRTLHSGNRGRRYEADAAGFKSTAQVLAWSQARVVWVKH